MLGGFREAWCWHLTTVTLVVVMLLYHCTSQLKTRSFVQAGTASVNTNVCTELAPTPLGVKLVEQKKNKALDCRTKYKTNIGAEGRTFSGCSWLLPDTVTVPSNDEHT